MRTEEEIIERLKKVNKRVRCEDGSIATMDYDGMLSCKEGEIIFGSWYDLGVFRALCWVLEEKSEFCKEKLSRER